MKSHYVFDIEPVPKQRPRFSFKTKSAYTPKKTASFEKQLAALAQAQAVHCYDVPISITVIFTLTRPKTVKREFPTAKNDADNLIKGVCDALNNIAWKDDSLICEIHAKKEYGKSGKITLTIEEL